MPLSNNVDHLVDDLASSLKSTTELVQSLLGEIRDNATAMAILREKLETLRENVSILTKIIRDGNGSKSLITRMALVERYIEDFDEFLEEFKEEQEKIRKEQAASKAEVENYRRSKIITTLRIVAVVAPGLIALGLTLFEYLMK